MTGRRGYSPQGYRPEPTVAPTTPAPISLPEDIDAFKDMRARIERVSMFIIDRLAEGPDHGSAVLHRSVGYAKGYAEACVDSGNIVGAVGQLGWLCNEAQRWSKHDDYEQAIR